MDLIDKKIMCEINTNCRQPLSKIGKKLRINRNVVDYRIKKLETDGIIIKYICALNLGVLGYKTYKIHFKLKGKQELEKEFVAALIKSKKTIYVLKIEGAFDYTATVAVKSILELDDFLMDLKSKFQDILNDYFISILVYSRVFKLDKLIQSRKEPIHVDNYSGEATIIKIDEKDKKILRALSQNANLPIVDLAKKTNLSIDIIKYRLKLLKQNIINSFRVSIDMNKIGYYHYIVSLQIKKANKKDEERLMTWCHFKNNVMFCSKRIGRYDFAINVAITDINDLNNFLSDLKKEFGDIIDSCDTAINSHLLKLNYVPF